MKRKIIIVKINGKKYKTYIDKNGIQRFFENKVIRYLVNQGIIDLNKLRCNYQQGKFDKKSYSEFNMMLGYSVCGYAELSSFEDWEIENPLWD